MRRLLAVSMVLATAAASAEEEFVQWAEPPGPATAQEERLLKDAAAKLDRGTAVSDVLVDPTLMSIHARTEFRKLIEMHAAAGPLTVAGPKEPGARLILELAFKDEAGAPLADALVYAYHTSAKGWYSDKGAHVRANSGDVNHARLFGYGRTGADGVLVLETIRPQGYPRSDLPAHVHLGLNYRGDHVPVGEVRFDDDPRMTPEVRRQSLQAKDVIVKPQALADGSLRARAEFRVRVRAR